MNVKCNIGRWARAAGVRAVKTMAQSAIAMIGTEAMFDDVKWTVVAGAAFVAGVLSLLTSVTGLPELCVDVASDNAGPTDDSD